MNTGIRALAQEPVICARAQNSSAVDTERQTLVPADIYAVIRPGLKYRGQRDAAALAVAELLDRNCRTARWGVSFSRRSSQAFSAHSHASSASTTAGISATPNKLSSRDQCLGGIVREDGRTY